MVKVRSKTFGIFSKELDLTYDTHNVYLQVLCECGIIGLCIYIFAIISSIYPCIRKYKTSIKTADYDKKSLNELGQFLQLFFILYSMSGNPLYDYSFFVFFFIGIFMFFDET